MRKRILFSVLVLLVLLVISTRARQVAALAERTESPSPERWTERELERFVDLALKNNGACYR